MAALNPALIDLSEGHSGATNPWYKFLYRAAGKIWTLPHAERRLSQLPDNTIIVYTIPDLPVWLARLIRLNLMRNHWVAPRILLSDGGFSTRYQNPLASLSHIRTVFLNLGIHGARSRASALNWIQELLSLAATTNKTLQFVPLIFHWNLSPKRRNYPAVYGFLFHNRNKIVSTGSPLQIEPGVTLEPPSTQSIRRNQIKNWNRESRAILGNRKLSMRRMVEAIQRESLLNHQLEVIASQGKDTLPTLLTRVSAYVREIAADYTYKAPQWWDKVISGFFRRNFTSIEFDKDGLDQLRLLLRDRNRVILTPSHRSHMDYLLISYSIFKQGLACPLVAAGQNLAFWPMGYFFRKTGAFFIRRTFKGLDIYPHVFRAYLWHILSRFQPVEFFIEGGRSRNGVLLQAKLGMLNMILEAVKTGRLDDVQIVPLAVNYDRIPEEQSYIDELQGKPKKKEKVTSLLRSAHLLRRQFGQVAVATGQPLSMKALIKPELTSLEQKDHIGCSIMNQIRLTMPVTPGSILVTIAMGIPHGQMANQDQITAVATELLDLIKRIHPESPLAMDFHRTKDVDTIWFDGLQRMKLIGNLTEKRPGHWKVNSQRRLQVDYLRNSIFGLLLGICLVAAKKHCESKLLSPIDLASIFCPECHPIPVSVLLGEIEKANEASKALSPGLKGCLVENILPQLSFCQALAENMKAQSTTIDKVLSNQWKKMCRTISSDMGEYPELAPTLLHMALLRGFKRLQTRQTVDTQ